MARRVELNWTNPYFEANKETIVGLTQVIERKVADGAWTETPLVPVAGVSPAFTAVDEDMIPDGSVQLYKYRIVTVNGTARTNGNVIEVSVPISSDAVIDLEGAYVP